MRKYIIVAPLGAKHEKSEGQTTIEHKWIKRERKINFKEPNSKETEIYYKTQNKSYRDVAKHSAPKKDENGIVKFAKKYKSGTRQKDKNKLKQSCTAIKNQVLVVKLHLKALDEWDMVYCVASYY